MATQIRSAGALSTSCAKKYGDILKVQAAANGKAIKVAVVTPIKLYTVVVVCKCAETVIS